MSRLPHERVYVRLGVSPIAGIGVFAQQEIALGTNVFPADTTPITWVPRTLLDDAALCDFQRALYEDFAIRRGALLGCPPSFELLTVGWYCNEPHEGQEPNLIPTLEFDLVTARDVRAGEELTVRYSDFAEAT
jgi:hypothetical protein